MRRHQLTLEITPISEENGCLINRSYSTITLSMSVIHCSACRRYRKNNPYASGTTNFKHTNILRNIKSLDHRAALESEGCRSLTDISSEAKSQNESCYSGIIYII